MEDDEDEDFLQLLDEVGLPRDAFGDKEATQVVSEDDPVLDFLKEDGGEGDEDDDAEEEADEEGLVSASPKNAAEADGQNSDGAERDAEAGGGSHGVGPGKKEDDDDDFLGWLLNDKARSPTGKHHLDARRLVQEAEASHHGDPDEESGTLARLQAALDGEDSAENAQRILNVCKRLGRIPAKYRAQVWCKLLHTSEDVRASSRQHGRGQQPSREDEESVLKAMTESAVLRHANLAAEQCRLSPAEDQGEVLREADDLHVEVQMHTRVVVRAFDVEISLCDPGIADVVHVLASPALKLSPFEVAPLVQELRRKRVLLLQFPDDDTVVPGILQKRAKLLELVVRLHDADLAAHVFGIGPPQVVIPWRWWRCAFAGEVVTTSLLTIWDLLIVDACPETNGDHGPSQASPLTGVWEGCDPRGPLAVYMMIALLVKCKPALMPDAKGNAEADDDEQTLLDQEEAKGAKTSPQHFLGVLRAAVARIPASEAVQLCDEARILRASTPLDVIEEAFLDATVDQQSTSAKDAASAHGPTGAAARLMPTSSSETLRENVSAVFGGWLGARTGGTARVDPQGSAKREGGGYAAKSWSDKMKLTLGLGGLSADTLAHEKAMRDAHTKSQTAALQEHIQIVAGDDVATTVDADLLVPQCAQAGLVQSDGAESVADLTNTLPANAAQAKHELSGLCRGALLTLSIFRPLAASEWVLFPICIGEESASKRAPTGLLVVAHYRLVFLQPAAGADGLPPAEELAKRSQLAVLGDFESLNLVVVDARHISELSHLILVPVDDSPQNFRDVVLRYHHPAERCVGRFQMPTDCADKLCELARNVARDLFL